MTSNKNAYLKIRDNLFISLLLTLIIDVTCLALGQIQGITNFNYTLHELLYLPVNFSILIIPIELIMLIYYSTRYFMDICKATIVMDLKYKIKASICVICMVFTIGLIYYQFNIVQTFGVYNITNKITDENSLYIVVDNMKLKCTKNEYNLININEEYLINYNWNHLKPNVGKLHNIRKANKE